LHQLHKSKSNSKDKYFRAGLEKTYKRMQARTMGDNFFGVSQINSPMLRRSSDDDSTPLNENKLKFEVYECATKKYFEDVLYSKELLSDNGTHSLFLKALSVRHDYFAAFFGYSLRNRRFIRWLRLIYTLLIVLFLDTLFYDVFYPANGYCESFQSIQDCLSPQNEALSDNTCLWTIDSTLSEGGSCSLNPPPTSFLFNVIVSFLLVIGSIPPLLLFDYIVEMYARNSPRLYNIGVNAIIGLELLHGP